MTGWDQLKTDRGFLFIFLNFTNYTSLIFCASLLCSNHKINKALSPSLTGILGALHARFYPVRAINYRSLGSFSGYESLVSTDKKYMWCYWSIFSAIRSILGEVLAREKLRQMQLIRFRDAHWEKQIPLQDEQIHNMIYLSNC